MDAEDHVGLDRMIADLTRFVAIRSISSDPDHADDVRRSANEIAAAFAEVGAAAEVVTAPGGLPSVVGRLPGPKDAPVVLLYAHHDVQPIGRRSEWHSDPFTLTERGGRLFGRGAADDKGGIAVHLETLRQLGPELPANIAILIEGEEEIGSPTLPQLLADHQSMLAADVVLALDSVNADQRTPSLTESLRGLLNVVITVRTANRAMHSGIYGGAVPDALSALIRLLATVTDAEGVVEVAGLAAGVTGSGGPSAEQIRGDSGMLPSVELVGRGSMADRLWNQPVATVTGIDATPVDSAANVLSPVARASVSFRLAPEDDPATAAQAIERHFRTHAPWGVDLGFEVVASGRGWRARNTRTAEMARTALNDAYGTAPVPLGVGGGIPFVATLTEALPDVDVVVTAVQDPVSNAHAPNESVDTFALTAAARAQVSLIQRLSRAT